MSGFEIGLSGLNVARKALEIVGTNISNVSTEGYHKQTPIIQSVEFQGQTGVSLGGATVAGSSRAIDPLLEGEILSQTPQSGQLNQELQTLQSVEDSLGTLNSQGLMNSINNYYSSLQQLAGQPASRPYQQQAVSAAGEMAGQFNTFSRFLQDLSGQINVDAQDQTAQANQLISQIADLNGKIQMATQGGDSGNMLLDQRDQAIKNLAAIVGVQTAQAQDGSGMVNVVAWGTPVVTGGTACLLQTAVTTDGQLGVSAQGALSYQTHPSGGTLGGLMALKNDLLKNIAQNVDQLAAQIISSTNQIHVQGVGSAGSFTELTGQSVSSQPLADWNAGVQTGDFYVRITDQSTGTVTRQAVHVDSTGTIQDVAAAINAVRVNGVQALTASLPDSALHIQAAPGYQFDFLPAVTADPLTETIGGTSRPTLSGLYTGASNQAFTCTVVGGGTIGLTSGLSVQVTDGSGQLVKTVNVGTGYAAGDALDLGQGISAAFNAGTLNTGDTFTIQALANSNPTGFLAAAGMNTMFHGDSAATMAVSSDLVNDPGRIATASGADLSDNANITNLANLATARLPGLGNQTAVDFYQQIVTGIGQQVQTRQDQKTSMDSLMQQLENQKDSLSGVDINDQAAQLLQYEQMYQGMAKFIGTINDSVNTLLQIIK